MAKAAKSTALVNVREELAKEAAEIASRIQAPSGDLIRCTQDKQFVLPDGTKSPGPLSMVIVDFLSGNFFYDRPYKRGEESPPACFALGTDPKNLIPDASSPDKQADDCKSCPNNAWGSNGAGKACGNTRLLALVHPDAEADAKPWILKVSATGTTAFDSYVGTIKSQFNTPPIGVVTQIYFDPNLTYGSLRFGDPKDNKNLDAHFALKKSARERLSVAPDVSQYKPYVEPKKGKK